MTLSSNLTHLIIDFYNNFIKLDEKLQDSLPVTYEDILPERKGIMGVKSFFDSFIVELDLIEKEIEFQESKKTND